MRYETAKHIEKTGAFLNTPPRHNRHVPATLVGSSSFVDSSCVLSMRASPSPPSRPLGSACRPTCRNQRCPLLFFLFCIAVSITLDILHLVFGVAVSVLCFFTMATEPRGVDVLLLNVRTMSAAANFEILTASNFVF